MVEQIRFYREIDAEIALFRGTENRKSFFFVSGFPRHSALTLTPPPISEKNGEFPLLPVSILERTVPLRALST